MVCVISLVFHNGMERHYKRMITNIEESSSKNSEICYIIKKVGDVNLVPSSLDRKKSGGSAPQLPPPF